MGLGFEGGGSNAKLSPERKFRMRELATQKLAKAYQLDEVATSVATMQGASSMDDVAQLVLKRNPRDLEAKYVHFFHEKIPSRMMTQCTPLTPLDEIIAARPNDGAPLRTRAVTKIFKEDWLGVARDLTDGLAIARYVNAQHKAGRQQLVLARTIKEEQEQRRNGRGNWRQDSKLAEEDQPDSLEAQLLFYRANVYLTIACNHVDEALKLFRDSLESKGHRLSANSTVNEHLNGETPEPTAVEWEAHRRHLEARKVVKTYAKRAARDYLSFLSRLDYTPGLSVVVAKELQRRVNTSIKRTIAPNLKTLEMSSNPSPDHGTVSSALVLHNGTPEDALLQTASSTYANGWPSIQAPEVHQLSSLFSATPPSNLPPHPSVNTSIHPPQPTSHLRQNLLSAATAEAVTYHPLLAEVLHSLLLTHCLVQTSPTELRRHAHNAARIARLLDGYPVFLSWRSPARTDWIEVLQLTGNWIGLPASWEQLCEPASSSEWQGFSKDASQSHRTYAGKGPMELYHPAASKNPNGGNVVERSAVDVERERGEEKEEVKRERIRKQAIVDALSDERVVDEVSFHKACRAREKRAWEWEEAVAKNGGVDPLFCPPTKEEEAEELKDGVNGGVNSKPQQKDNVTPEPAGCAQEDGGEYSIATERAEAIARWVREAPLSVGGVGGKVRRGGKKNGSKSSGGTMSRQDDSVRSASTAGLEDTIQEEVVD